MAKATIAMAMKETGFGQDALRYLPKKQEPIVTQNRIVAPQYGHEDGNLLDPNLRPHPRQKRPAPRFDMDLKDLFSDEEYTNRPSKARRAQYHAASQVSTVKREISTPYQATSMPPQLDSLRGYRRQQPSPHLYAPSTPIDPSLHISAPGSSASPSQQQQQQNNYFPSNMQPYSGPQSERFAYQDNAFDNLDFLENFQATDSNGGDVQHSVTADGSREYPNYDHGFGVGGLAFDGGSGPSWDDNGGFDLFDGFFFGGASGAAH